MGRIEKLTLYSLILLLIWGNMVSGLGAGLACPDWPLCFGSFFPEINFDKVEKIRGLDITIVIASISKEHSYELLKKFNFPFKLKGAN